MDANLEKIRHRFIQGEYQSIVDQLLHVPVETFTSDCLPWLTASLARLGRSVEAEVLWASGSKTASLHSQVIHYFFLGITYTRQQKRDQAKNCLRAILRLRQQKACRPLIHQFIAFQHYYNNEWEKAIHAGHKAWALAMGQGQDYYCYLSQDLIGHANAKLGYGSLAQRHLRLAKDFAYKMNSMRCINAVEISLCLYEAQANPFASGILKRLQRCLTVHCEDDYSKGRVLLEMTVQHLLYGNYHHARKYLNEAKIFASQTGNFGHFREAAAIQDFVNWLTEHPQQAPKPLSTTPPQAGEVFSKICQFLHQRSPILSMWHEWQDAAGRDRAGLLKTILEQKALGLLPFLLDLPGQMAHLLSGLPNKLVILIHQDQVTAAKGHLPASQVNVLQRLCHGPQDRKDLVESLWGYQYNPLRHDSLVFPLIAKLRKELKRSFKLDVERVGNAYSLSQPVTWTDSYKLIHNPKFTAHDTGPMSAFTRSYNPRQKEILSLEPGTVIAVKSHKSLQHVSRASASRDLRELSSLGYLQAVGKGRGAKYQRTSMSLDIGSQNLNQVQNPHSHQAIGGYSL